MSRLFSSHHIISETAPHSASELWKQKNKSHVNLLDRSIG